MGEYGVQAAVAALHDAALSHEDTDWATDPLALRRCSNG